MTSVMTRVDNNVDTGDLTRNVTSGICLFVLIGYYWAGREAGRDPELVRGTPPLAKSANVMCMKWKSTMKLWSIFQHPQLATVVEYYYLWMHCMRLSQIELLFSGVLDFHEDSFVSVSGFISESRAS